FDGAVEAELRAADRAGRDVEPSAIEARHRDLEAVAFVADQVLGRYPAVLEHHHRGRLRFPAELLLPRAERDAWRPLLDHDAGDALRPFATSPHHADVDIRHAAAGDERLAAVQHVVVAVAD